MNDYNASSITVLKGLDAVRKRPGMYIGDTDDGSGLHHMVYEVIDNSIDEALAGFCNKIDIIIQNDGSVSVIDNGRGIPVDIHEDEGIPAAEVIMTQLHAGGKFDHNSYKVSGGLHGVGISVVNALSSWLELTIWRNGKEYFMRFEDGVTVTPLSIVADNITKKGTKITFLPSKDIFSFVNFNYSTLENRIRELSFLNSNINMNLKDLRDNQVSDSSFGIRNSTKTSTTEDKGTSGFVKYLDRNKNPVTKVIHIEGSIPENGINVELSMHWNDSYYENMLCFTNNIRQRDGGTHLAGFRSAMTRCINNYATNEGFLKKAKVSILGEDVREGLTCVLSIKLPDPKFSSQTKDKLVSSEARTAVENIVYEQLTNIFETNPKLASSIIERIIRSAKGREAARKARDLIKSKNGFDFTILPGKLADCQEKSPELSELFIVEGNSAGGSAKQGRDRRSQAVLSLKGKILNVERASLDRILSSSEIASLITAVGSNIGVESFDIEKVRYHKVIIMTDADVDGSHIRTLLLTFFFRYMREIIEKGYLYIAQPPLYKVTQNKKELYIKNDEMLHNYIINNAIKNVTFIADKDYSGNSLSKILHQCIEINKITKSYSRVVPQNVLESLIIFFRKNGCDSAERISNHLNKIFCEYEWNVEIPNKDNITIFRLSHGLVDKYYLDSSTMNSEDIKRVISMCSDIEEAFNSVPVLSTKDNNIKIDSPTSLVDNIIEFGKKDMTLQRFKGLGEMNADQLWDTTLNPDTRTLLKIKISDCEAADAIFSVLMGDFVEPRRDFINNNALNVQNIDA
ncbi:DNA topoisomerase (ATP-hydrolyzing) subunit B [Ehrlichia ruminantium]|uniref:DNA gyrase subunit B n=1 Tax=Ehrlichia ruminantium TaxID=779 RepID=A0AAE6UID4_EHRRU|nr:DNA topoisomerase (ATP-hydrolyzing) subunit B [Ehrlichia ruminantium]QGR02498.1 DNA topoisomerase (ATP-hydrolyzing) subunit B [Ehrlichia ruminantium]QGR03419.1 DNA topoisomerase (ATP-hydrolyzing) subunit B [Ehrlichia ruminantium]QGR04347.1 DNA topoisomerase (ATP-hydrolyzing) subunit B [Ehrlichia ruminantium]